MSESLRPVLNYDILLEVLKVCDRADCSRFMRTARFFNAHGLEALLSHHMSFSKEATLLERLAYLRGDPGRRHKYVRDLRLNIYDLTEPAALELADALRQMSHLEELSLDCSEDLVLSHPSIAEALAGLTSVRNLYLHYLGPHTIQMLLSFRSQLEKIDISFLGEGEEDGFFDLLPGGDVQLYHPAILFQRSQASLQSITSFRWTMDVEALPDPKLVYPQMRRLELERTPLPRTVAFIRAYPNLTHFSLMTDDMETSRFHADDLPVFDTRHLLNVSEQVQTGPTWIALQEFKGTLLDLYVLGLTCLIDRIKFHSVQKDLLYMLNPVLTLARPRCLKLDGWPGRLKGPPEDVFACLRGQNSSRLETLSIDAWLRKKDSAVDIAAVFEGLRASLQGAPLQDLQMRIVITDLDPRPDQTSTFAIMRRQSQRLPTPPSPNPDDYPLCFAERSGEDFDLGDYVRRFMEHVPSLRRANVILDGPRDRWRRATIVDGQPQVEDKATPRRSGSWT